MPLERSDVTILTYSDDWLHGQVNDDMGHQCACLKASVAKDNSGSQNPYHVIVKYAKSVVTAMSRSDTIHDPVSKYAELGPGGEARHGTDTFTAEPGQRLRL